MNRLRITSVAIALCIAMTSGLCSAGDTGNDTMAKPMGAWVKVPQYSSRIWIQPNVDTYEHSTGLIRKPNGQHQRPLTQAAYAQRNRPAEPQRYGPPPQPFRDTSCPNCRPQRSPTFPWPDLPQSPANYDYGPYAPSTPQPYRYPAQPNACPQQRPSSTGWFGPGQGQYVDPMTVPKTGDAPLYR